MTYQGQSELAMSELALFWIRVRGVAHFQANSREVCCNDSIAQLHYDHGQAGVFQKDMVGPLPPGTLQ